MISEKILFFTPVFYSKLDIDNLHQIIENIKIKEKYLKSTNQSNVGGWQSPMFKEIENTYYEIIEKLNLLMNEVYLKYQSSKPPKLRQYWFNINKNNDYNYPHTHLNEHFSGVLYLQVPKNSGNITFYNPLEPTNLEISEYNPYTYTSYHFTPSIGDVFIFQSTLVHSVEKNESEEERISMAFDYQ